MSRSTQQMVYTTWVWRLTNTRTIIFISQWSSKFPDQIWLSLQILCNVTEHFFTRSNLHFPDKYALSEHTEKGMDTFLQPQTAICFQILRARNPMQSLHVFTFISHLTLVFPKYRNIYYATCL